MDDRNFETTMNPEHRLMARVSVDDAAEADKILICSWVIESRTTSRIHQKKTLVYSTLDV